MKTLEFDSKLFHEKIASCEVTSDNDYKKIKRLFDTKKIDLLYLKSKTSISQTKIIKKLDCTLSYVDEKVLFQKQFNTLQSILKNTIIHTNSWDEFDMKFIENLAIASGKYSRFFLDPLINKDCSIELYLLWLRKSLSLELSDEIYISGGNIPSGLLTVKFSNEIATVGLLAVDERFRGQGIASALLLHMQNTCIKKNIHTIQIPTQRVNNTACKFYLKSGYKEVSSSFIYHCRKKNG